MENIIEETNSAFTCQHPAYFIVQK